ncbi:LysR family transcriptional regulator [Neobacillus niacini]|uniref:LysR family transcriptional regulator n=1 Tax=Neobacillus niacini TaxID=86668 RepID=UPI0021CAEB03|nr:LysR family transcriptional regulator [Neobacillus niacini]MCM3764459.1 LysR family transcriptional regulator [Neobacillus niacini]
MNIQQLRYFVTVANHLNFTTASKELYVSQASVSKQISIFEEYLGVKLFHRTKRSVELTESGGVLLKEALEIINKIDEAIDKTRKAHECFENKTLRIGFLGPPEKRFLPQLLNEFRNHYPEILLETKQYYLSPLLNAFEKDEIDIAFSSLQSLKTNSITYHRLYGDSYVVICSKDHPLTKKDGPLHLSELRDSRFIVLNKEIDFPAYENTLLTCKSAGFTPININEVANFEHIMTLVEANHGISIIPKLVYLYYDNFGVEFLPIMNDPIQYDLVVAWKKENNNPVIPKFHLELSSIFERMNLKNPH